MNNEDTYTINGEEKEVLKRACQLGDIKTVWFKDVSVNLSFVQAVYRSGTTPDSRDYQDIGLGVSLYDKKVEELSEEEKVKREEAREKCRAILRQKGIVR
jgi:hypothetical protein